MQGDRIHPDNHGNMLMAYFFLKSQGLAGKPVAKVDIDASDVWCWRTRIVRE